MKPIKEKRGGAMLATERRQRIMQEMHEHKVVVIVELAEKLGVTPMTIRRDLNLLEQQGLVEKSYGGAVLIESSIKENPYLTRKQVKNPEKRLIAQAAADLVEPSMSIYLDAGTTSYELAALLVEKEYQQLTIVTNDLLVAHMVSQNSNYQVIILGGVIENANGLTCGYLAK
ncbi:MAG: DeoR/GlpR transcriptional regulator, partial [Acidaminococcaceae bacterium]|nr:DeoR/GlpR transcriptional regulator [Acidaminococcaceae bacterium]